MKTCYRNRTNINEDFLQEVEDTGINFENILPRIRQNLTIINEEPVYHTLQSRVQLIPQQPGQEFCQQYSQDPPETSLASSGFVDICFMCNKSF